MNLIKHCPVAFDHLDIGEKIFGTDVATLKGEATHRQMWKVLEDRVNILEKV